MRSAAVLGGLMVGMTLAGAAASGCGQAAEYCDLMCECELCNDRKYDECIIEVDGDIDRADAYECSAEYDALHECVIDRADCDDNNWTIDADDCDNEAEDLYECIEDATGYDTGSSSSSSGSDLCFCSCTCESGMTGTDCNGMGCCSGQCEAQCQNDGLGSATATDEFCGDPQG